MLEDLYPGQPQLRLGAATIVGFSSLYGLVTGYYLWLSDASAPVIASRSLMLPSLAAVAVLNPFALKETDVGLSPKVVEQTFLVIGTLVGGALTLNVAWLGLELSGLTASTMFGAPAFFAGGCVLSWYLFERVEGLGRLS